jgi:pimeloyl-ACP methyl ester carboxylesterase
MSSGVRFLHSRVEAQIAYRTQGTGPPLIIIPPWINHLDAITAMSGYRQFNDAVAAQHTVVHYDRWGTGLSDRDRHDFSLKGEVQVLTDVADHLGLRRFALMGPSRGGPVAVAFAHGEARRVSHLILYGTGGGPLHDAQTWPPLRDLMLANWPAATKAIAALATPGCNGRDVEAFAALMRAAATPEMTAFRSSPWHASRRTRSPCDGHRRVFHHAVLGHHQRLGHVAAQAYHLAKMVWKLFNFAPGLPGAQL